MGRKDKELSLGLTVLLLATLMFGTLFWMVRFANAWDTNIGRMVATIDVFMEKAYGLAVPKAR